MYRRRQEEIQKDYWLCKKYIDSHPRVSIKEIAKAVHLSESKVKTSLRQNPRDFEKNMEKIFKVVIDASITGVKDFECVVIDETLETPDDCIIKYCAGNKSNVILFTADKTMDLKARAFGVKTKFFKQPKSAENSMKKPHKKVFFIHYEINSTDEENNCKIIYFKKIYNKGQIRKLPKEKYKSFIREFINEGKR